ncbi:hypothetical protein FOZ63_016795, partial [Perkinsus olseni]
AVVTRKGSPTGAVYGYVHSSVSPNNREASGFISNKRRAQAQATRIDMKYFFAVMILSMSCVNIAAVDRDFVAGGAGDLTADIVQNDADTRNRYQSVYGDNSVVAADVDGRLLRDDALCDNCLSCRRSKIGMVLTHCLIIFGICGGTDN